MHITDFYSKLRKLDIHLWLDGEKLRFNAPEGVFTQEIKDEILQRKADIIKFLKTSGNMNDTDNKKIQAVQDKKDVPLSYSQQRLWLVGQMDVDNYAYNIPAAVKLEGSLNIKALEAGIDEIVQRHNILCTTLQQSNGKVIQTVNSEMKIPLVIIDLSSEENDEKRKHTEEQMREEAVTPFRMDTGPLMRAKLVIWDKTQYVLLLTMHHIISDDWSLNVFVRELAILYNSFVEGKKSPLLPLPIQYGDYAIWQRDWLEKGGMDEQLEFWRNKLQNIEEIPDFPSDYTRPPIQTYNGHREFIMLPAETLSALKQLSQKESTTLFTVLLSVLKLLLYQYSGLTDIVVGAPVSGRTKREVEELIGYFVNTVVLRTQIDNNLTFRQWMGRVKETAADAFENQDIPFEKLVETFQTKRDRSRTPFFQVMFNMLNSSLQADLSGISIKPYTEFIIGAPNLGAKLDITLLAIEHNSGLQLDFSFNADLFSEETIQWLLGHLKVLLNSVVKNPDALISELPELMPRPVHNVEISRDFTPMKKEDIEQSIAERFEARAGERPLDIAAETEDECINYSELNKKADILASHIYNRYDDRYVLTKEEKARYTRQLYLDNWGLEAQEKLKALTVFAAGAGGSGSPTIFQLALLGVGTIIICDFDNVELSNLNRQMLHDESRIGMNKAVSAAMSVQRINPNVKVIVRQEKITRDNVFELVGDSAVIFDNVDDIEAKFILSECAVARGIPHVISSMLERSSYAAIFHTPYTPCFHCLYDAGKLEHVRAMRAADGGKNKVPNSVSSPALFLSTGFACNEALKVVLGLENPAYNKYFFFNQQASRKLSQTRGFKIVTYPFSDFFLKLCREQGFDWQEGFSGRFVEEIDIKKNPHCPLCSSGVSANPLKDTAYKAIEQCTLSKEEPNKQANDAIDPRRPQLVALLLGHDIGMLTGILGTLKAGKAFVVMDPKFPADRLEYILRDTNARLIVTDRAHAELANSLRNNVNKNVGILELEEVKEESDLVLPQYKGGPDSLAYIVYTSGSMGYPKGVMQTQRNLQHFIMNYVNGLHISRNDRLSLIPSFSFSASMMDTFAALLTGARLCLYDIRSKGPQRLAHWINDKQITVYHSVPTVFRHFTSSIPDGMTFPGLRVIDFGGEPVSRIDFDLYKKHFEDDCKLVNGLGATELNVIRQYVMDKNSVMIGSIVPVGYPVEDTEILLLDEEGKPVGYNRPGEIVIRSRYLSPGYWELEEQTNAVFEYADEAAGIRLYHTGDLGRFRTDGCMEHLGRRDLQLKIRGIRIEASEIETVMLEMEEIIAAAIMAEDNPMGDKQLTAYIVAEGENSKLPGMIYEYLSKRIPEYMIPSCIVRLSALPQTFSGKINRRALAGAGGIRLESTVEYIAPTNEMEKLLADLWKKVLRRNDIGINDDFFRMGGDSLLALRLIDMAHQFGLHITPQQLFQNPTIAKLSKIAKVTEKSQIPKNQPEEKLVTGEVKLLPVQKRFFGRNFTNMEHWDCAFMLYSRMKLNEKAITMVFEKIVEHHDALRIVFKRENGLITQYNRGIEGKIFELEVFDFTGVANLEDSIAAEVNRIHGSMNLENGPLVRLALFHTADGDHLLLIIHHLIFDGYSSNIFLSDLENAYFQLLKGEDIQFPEKSTSLQDWSERLYEYAAGKKLLEELDYWKGVEKSVSIPLPKDSIAVSNKIKDNRAVFVKLLEEEYTRKLMGISGKMSIDIQCILLTGLGMAIRDWSGSDKTFIHIVSHGREKIFEDMDISRTIGWFSVYYPFLLELTDRSDPTKELNHVKDGLDSVPGNGIGYEILKFLTPPENRDNFMFSVQPEISFNYAGNLVGRKTDSSQPIVVSPISSGVTAAAESEREYTFVLDLNVTNDILNLKFHYNIQEYKDSTIDKLLDSYSGNLKRLIDALGSIE